MQINLDDFFGTNQNTELSVRSSDRSKHNGRGNGHILMTSESYSEDLEGSERSLLKLNENLFDLESPEDEEYSEEMLGYEKSQSTKKSYSSKLPGERLFYQSQAIEMRKRREQEQKKELEMQQQVGLFAPKINQKSKQLKSHYVTNEYNPSAQIKKLKMREQQHEKNFLKQKIKQQQQCTFKPTINTKTQQLTKNRSTPAFQSLYHTSKTQQIRKQLRTQQAEKALRHEPKPKQQVQKAFQSFLERNEDFKNKHKNKLQLLDSKLKNYDNDGEKLFTPKISSKVKSSTTLTPKKQSPSLKDLNEMLLKRMKKMPTKSELFEQIAEQKQID